MNYLAAVWFVLLFAVSGAVFAQDAPDMDEILNLYDSDNSNNKDQALAQVEQLLAVQPNNVQAMFLHGLLQMEQQDIEGARMTFSTIAQRYPRLPEAFNNLAAIYAGEGEYEKARNALLSAIANAPDYATVRANLGDLYIKMALDAYEDAMSLDAGDSSVEASVEAKREYLLKMFSDG